VPVTEHDVAVAGVLVIHGLDGLADALELEPADAAPEA
jgi:hypothetical protein